MDNRILFEEVPAKSGVLGVITLNHPKALNALTHDMTNALYYQLLAWEDYHDLLAVIITTDSERAFCSGGDIRALYQNQRQPSIVLDFFHDEYCLNHLIGNYSKPFVALMQGIVMGGGAGISIHGSHRVASDSLIFAMPETAIGLFTDIGSSYFLNKAPGYLGRYLALSGARISASDAYYAGLVDYCVSSNDFSDFIDALTEIDFNENTAHETISEMLERFAVQPDDSFFQGQQDFIDSIFCNDQLATILSSLARDDRGWAKTVYDHLLQKSPTSLCVTLELLKRAKNMDLSQCLQQDFCVSQTMIRGHDFFEGIRATIIDKDMRPQWKPASLNDISEDAIATYFAKNNKFQLPF